MIIKSVLRLNFILTKKEFKKIRKDFTSYSMNSSMLELQAINQQCKELGWLEDEKTIEKTNYDHYKKGILQLCINDLAISKGQVTKCHAISCDKCDFVDVDGTCIGRIRIQNWFNQPYKKFTYKLSQFEFDLINTYYGCSENCKLSDCRSLKELKDKGYFKCVDYNTKISSILKACEVREDKSN